MNKNSTKINLTTRLFAGTITGVIKNNPGYYVVNIPELATEHKEIIVYDEATNYKYTNSDFGTYGSWYPLQKGTKVLVRFKKNDFNSGVIERIFSYKTPVGQDKTTNYYLLLETLSNSKLYCDDNTGEVKITLADDTAYTTYKMDSVKIHATNQLDIESTNLINVYAPQIFLYGGVSPDATIGQLIKGTDITKEIPQDNPTSKMVNNIKSNTIPTVKTVPYTNQMINNTINITNLPSDKQKNIITILKNELGIDVDLGDTFTTRLKDESNTDIIDNTTNLKDELDINTDLNINTPTRIHYVIIPSQKTIKSGIINFNKISDKAINELTNKNDEADKAIEKFNSPETFKTYFDNLNNLHNELSQTIDQYYNSPEYTNLSDDDKQLADEMLSPALDTLNMSYSTLQDMNNRYMYNKPINTPTTKPLDKNYDSVLNIGDQLVQSRNNIDISNKIDTLNNKRNKINNTYNAIQDISNLKKHNDITQQHIDDILNLSTNEKIKKLKSNIFNSPANSKLFRNYAEKIGEITSEYLDKNNLVINKLKVLGSATITSLNDFYQDSKLKGLISDYNDIVNTLSDKTMNIINLVNDLKHKAGNVTNYLSQQDFYNTMDEIIHNITENNTYLNSIKSLLANKNLQMIGAAAGLLNDLVCNGKLDLLNFNDKITILPKLGFDLNFSSGTRQFLHNKLVKLPRSNIGSITLIDIPSQDLTLLESKGNACSICNFSLKIKDFIPRIYASLDASALDSLINGVLGKIENLVNAINKTITDLINDLIKLLVPVFDLHLHVTLIDEISFKMSAKLSLDLCSLLGGEVNNKAKTASKLAKETDDENLKSFTKKLHNEHPLAFDNTNDIPKTSEEKDNAMIQAGKEIVNFVLQ